MVRFLVLFLFVSVASAADAAKAPIDSVIDVLRETPATLQGEISLDQTTEVFRKDISVITVKLRVNGSKPISYELNEHHLELVPDKALTLSIQGIPVNIQRISYDHAKNKFSVKTETPLGLGQEKLNETIEKTLNEQYRPKVVKAYEELSKIRSQRNLEEVKKVIESIGNIFATGKGTPLPGLKGDVKLIFDVKDKKVFSFGDWKAHVDAGDNFSAGISFVRSNNKLAINSVELNSKKGLLFHGKTKYPEVVSVTVSQLKLDENGTTFVHRPGIRDTIAGFGLVKGLLQTLSGQPVTGIPSSCNCDVPLTTVESMINESIDKQIRKLVKIHRQKLLDAKFSPELLAAFE